MDDVIDLSSGNLKFTISELIINAAFEKAKQRMGPLFASEELPELRQEICDFYQKKYQLYFTSDQVLVSVRALETIQEAKIAIPEYLSLISFNDAALVKYVYSEMTSVLCNG